MAFLVLSLLQKWIPWLLCIISSLQVYVEKYIGMPTSCLLICATMSFLSPLPQRAFFPIRGDLTIVSLLECTQKPLSISKLIWCK